MQDTHKKNFKYLGRGSPFTTAARIQRIWTKAKHPCPKHWLQLSFSKIMPSAARIAVLKVCLFIKPHIPLRIQSQKESRWSCWEEEEILSPGARASGGSAVWWLGSGPPKSFHWQTTGINYNFSDWLQGSSVPSAILKFKRQSLRRVKQGSGVLLTSDATRSENPEHSAL